MVRHRGGALFYPPLGRLIETLYNRITSRKSALQVSFHLDIVAAMQKEMTATQAAAKLGVTRARVHQLIRAGRLSARQVGNFWIINPADLAAVRVRKPGRPKGKK